MPKTKKKSFVLYNDYYEHINMLSDEEAGMLMKAVFMYAETGEVPELQGMTKMAFSFISSQLDRDREKYEERCQKNHEIALEREQKKREEKKA
ncbi:MAG: DUF6291 domain-containing protein [Ruminococcus sp.]|nr:DUF6291 domain-containing protein [Ruminococcus sp.]